MEYDETFRLYRFRQTGAQSMELELETTHPDFTRGRLALRDTATGRYPLAGGGLYFRSEDAGLLEPRLFRVEWPVTGVEHALLGGAVVMTVTERLEDVEHRKRYELRPVGGAIAIHARSLDGVVPATIGHYAGFTGGDIEGWSDAIAVRIPYMGMAPVTMVARRLFVGLLLDPTASHGTDLAPRGPASLPDAFTNEISALYAPDAAGRVAPVDERAWLSVSTVVEDLFPVPGGPASPLRPGLLTKSFAHLETRGGATFDDAARWVERMASLGVRDLVLQMPALADPAAMPPSTLPIRPDLGDEASLARLTAAGDLIAAGLSYTSTVSGCPGLPNPAWREGDAPVDRDGVPKALDAPWPCADDTTTPRLLLGPTGAERVAADDAARLAAMGIGAANLDALAAWNPAWGLPGAPSNGIDRAVPPAQPSTTRGAVHAAMRLFDRLQRTLGPVFGDGAYGPWEARYDSLYAGWIDGTSRSLSTGVLDNSVAGENQLVMPDFELRIIRERMVGYGMGPYERFFGAEISPPLDARQRDAYRAASLTYGHAASWWTLGLSETTAIPWLDEAESLKEHYGLRPIVSRLLDRPIAAISYIGPDDEARDLSAALREELDLAGPRLRMRYGNGPLTLWVNHGTDVWPVQVRNRDLDLPPDGWAVDAPDLFAYSALREGSRVDFVQAPDYLLLDGRGVEVDFGVATARDLVIRFDDGRVLEEGPGGRMEWRP